MFLEGRNIFSGGLSLEAIYQSSGSSFRAFFVKVTKERSKTHKRLKERFLIRRNRTKRANFRCNHFFRAMYNLTENS